MDPGVCYEEDQLHVRRPRQGGAGEALRTPHLLFNAFVQ